MPVIRVSSGSESEGVGTISEPTFASKEVTRITNNLKLSEHLGQFVAGQVAGQFQNEDLAEMLKGKNMIMISASWG